MEWFKRRRGTPGIRVQDPRVHRIHAIDARTRHRHPNPADSFATPLPRWSRISSNTSSAPPRRPTATSTLLPRLHRGRHHIRPPPPPRPHPPRDPTPPQIPAPRRDRARHHHGRVHGRHRVRAPQLRAPVRGGDADPVDLRVIEMLELVSFGAGILPDFFVGRGTGTGTVDLVYMHAPYERVVRSKDAEVLSMLGSEVKGYPQISFNLIKDLVWRDCESFSFFLLTYKAQEQSCAIC